MVKGGDFDSIFSFTHDGMCKLFDAAYLQYKFAVNDPEKDAANRGIVSGGFDTPTQMDLKDLFEVIDKHANNYISIYYASDSQIAKDPAVQQWITDLNNTIPNGIKDVLGGPITRDNVSRLIACFMYLVSVQHDIVGSFLWNYQLWAHKQPPRLHRNGTRLPLDVYQRLVNANFNLNVPRTPLLNDFSNLVLPDLAAGDNKRAQAIQALNDFQKELKDLEAQWRCDPWYVWRVYPKLLEVNINA
jgi:arachidonate 15-lipoxygenase